MIVLSSPAKTLDLETEYPIFEFSTPDFIDKSKVLVQKLRSFKTEDLKDILNVSDKLAEVNYNRFQHWRGDKLKARPAIYMYKGDVFKQLDIENYGKNAISYLNEKLRIISGLYGVLKPLDLIEPYRLEMKTNIPGVGDLKDFWKEDITALLNTEMNKYNTSTVVNLASREYAEAIDIEKLKGNFFEISFLQNKNGNLKNIGLLSKRARGLMLDYMVKNEIKKLEQLKEFDREGYKLKTMNENKLVYVKNLE